MIDPKFSTINDIVDIVYSMKIKGEIYVYYSIDLMSHKRQRHRW